MIQSRYQGLRYPILDTISPDLCNPPHKVTHPDKLAEIVWSMSQDGWLGKALVGYEDEDGKIQLITGSHRWAAAKQIHKNIQVKIYPKSFVWKVWGHLDEWMTLINA